MTRAFTLIEALIAIALSMTVVVTAFLGVRAAATSTAAANQLSIENALMREGWLRANELADFWTVYDDPEAPDAERPLHGADAAGRGMPFTPFARTMAWTDTSDPELARGWDADEAWSPSDPKTWWRGDLAEKSGGELRHGRYAAFSHLDAAPTLGGGAAGAYGPVAVPHTWLANQTAALMRALGYYGASEYLPANAIYAWYQPWRDGVTNAGGMPLVLVRPQGAPAFTNPDGAQETARGLYRISFLTCFAMTDPRALADADAYRRWWWIGDGSSNASVQEFVDRTSAGEPLTGVAPAHWPNVRVRLNRFIKQRRFAAVAAVRAVSPVSSRTWEITFSTFTTSLRGARQQRARDGGWARWDDAPGARPDPTLDARPAPWTPPPHP